MSILNNFRLDGKVAVITGAGRGIGAAIARAYAEVGANVVLGARTEAEINRTADEVRALGAEALAVVTDVMNDDQLQQLADAAIEKFGKIDILVNNAGGFPPVPALDTTTEDFNTAFQFNVSTAFTLSRICVPIMMDTAGGGSIINIASVAGQAPSSCFVAYGVAKSALIMLTKELAQDFAPHIRVNAIAVGSTKTDALNWILTPEIEKDMVDLTPMARLGEVEDVANGALYLASPAASYVTGDVLGVNGGLTTLNMKMPRAFD